MIQKSDAGLNLMPYNKNRFQENVEKLLELKKILIFDDVKLCLDSQVKVTENLTDFWSLSHIIEHVYRLTLPYLLAIAIHKSKFVKNTHTCGIWDQTFANLDV